MTDVVGFLIIAFAVFVALKAFEKAQSIRKTEAGTEELDTLSVSEELLAEIRDLLRSQGGA